MLRSASLHYAGRSASVLAHEHKLGSLPVAEMDAGHRLLRNVSAPSKQAENHVSWTFGCQKVHVCSVYTTERACATYGPLYKFHNN